VPSRFAVKEAIFPFFIICVEDDSNELGLMYMPDHGVSTSRKEQSNQGDKGTIQ